MNTAQPSHYILGAGTAPVDLPAGVSLRLTDFARVRDDLWLSGSAAPVIVVRNYFQADTPPDLHAADGGTVTGEIARTLCGLSRHALAALASEDKRT